MNTEKVIDLEMVRARKRLNDLLNNMSNEELENFKRSALINMLGEEWKQDIIDEAESELVNINIEKLKYYIEVEVNNICSRLYYEDVEEDYKSLSFEDILKAFVVFSMKNTKELLNRGVKFVRVNERYLIDLIKEEVVTYPDNYFKREGNFMRTWGVEF